MAISVSSKTSNSITVSCSYPPYVPGGEKDVSWTEGCTITWTWTATGSTDSKSASSTSSATIRWYWTWNGSSWDANGWDPLGVDSTKSYSDGSGYSGTLTLQGVSPGSRPSPPPTGSYPVGSSGHVDASTGTATYSGTVSKTTYSWVASSWSHNAQSSKSYSDGTYSGQIGLASVDPGTRPSPSGTPTSSSSTTSATTSGVATYSGTATSPSSGATITRTKMYLNGVYVSDGSASNSFLYTFTGLTPVTEYDMTVQWFSSGDTLIGSNTVTDTTNANAIPSLPTVVSRGEGSLTLSWGSISGATNYQLDYKPSVNSVWNSVTTSSTSRTLSGLAYGLVYDFRVRAFSNGSWGGFSSVSNATVNPKTPSIDGTYVNGVVTITVDGMSGTTFDSVTIERLTSSGSFVDSKPVTSNGASVTWSITPSTIANYKFRAYSTEGAVNSVSYSNFVSFIRPVNFAFQYSTISSGSNAIVDRRDWNNLAIKINQFRTYKGLSQYSFTTITSSMTDITASLFNELVNGANALTPFMTNNTMPSTKSKGNDFYASYLTNIVNSINSIS